MPPFNSNDDNPARGLTVRVNHLKRRIIENTKSNDKILSNNILYFKPAKDLYLSSPKIVYSVDERNNQFIVTLKTDQLAKNVFVITNSENNFSDNYFDMLPNTEKTIFIEKDHSQDLKSFTENLSIKTLTDSFKK